MKFVFIIPPITKEVLHGEWDLSGVDSVSPPLGVLILAATLKKRGYDVSVIDAYAERLTLKETIKKISDFNTNAVGISFMTPAYESAISLAKAIKEDLRHILIIVGGAHITALPKETLQHAEFDYGVIGEGEETLPDLLDALDEKRNLFGVDGIVFKDTDGAIQCTKKRAFIQNMDALPFPDWGVVNLKNYRLSPVGTKGKYALPLLTSRGCPCRCTFCDTGGVGTKLRGYSTEYVLSMMDEVITKYGIREFVFYDDTFSALKKRTFEICEEISRRGWKIDWSCCARIDCISKEMLQVMKRAGCWQIEYGIESGCQEILDRVNKKISLEKVKEVIKWTKQAGIQTRGNFIFGFPGDTKETIERTIDFACSLELDYFQQGFLTPYPGSAIYLSAEKEGDFNRDWRKMNNITINFVPNGMTKEDLIALSKKAFRRFYLRPKIVFSHFFWLCQNPYMIFNYSRAFGTYLKTVFR